MGRPKLKNPPSKKERGLIKGAIRRVFSRSELRRRILDKSVVKDYGDPSRNRVTRWSRCNSCSKMEPSYLMEIDHELPIIPVDRSLDEMSWDEIIDNLWCDERNLKPLCKPCHKQKTKIENAERRKFQKAKK